MDAERPSQADPPAAPDDDGDPPGGTAWTLVVEGDGGWEADLEHAAPLPRIDETVEFIGEDGRRRVYRVTDVIHTVQTSASERPRVRDERGGPNSIVTEGADDDPPRALRAGLPRVVVAAADRG